MSYPVKVSILVGEPKSLAFGGAILSLLEKVTMTITSPLRVAKS